MLNLPVSRRKFLSHAAAAGAVGLSGCVGVRREEAAGGQLKGRVVVEWVREDGFVYRRQPDNPLQFKPSFADITIDPEDIYTVGGSIPRIFWAVPGLSPWGIGPAYIIHDWLFHMHRCKINKPGAELDFRQTAIVLAQVGQQLIEKKLIQHDMLDEIVWGVNSRYARSEWDRAASGRECAPPPNAQVQRRSQPRQLVVDFTL